VVGAGGIGLHVVQELHRRGTKVVVIEPDRLGAAWPSSSARYRH